MSTASRLPVVGPRFTTMTPAEQQQQIQPGHELTIARETLRAAIQDEQSTKEHKRELLELFGVCWVEVFIGGNSFMLSKDTSDRAVRDISLQALLVSGRMTYSAEDIAEMLEKNHDDILNGIMPEALPTVDERVVAFGYAVTMTMCSVIEANQTPFSNIGFSEPIALCTTEAVEA